MAAFEDVKEMVTVTELDDLLQCPVCYEVPSGNIYQCNQGHHVCGDCKHRIDLCPVCRSMFFGTRNYAMEELISNIKKLKIANNTLAVQTRQPAANNGGTSSSTSSNTTLGMIETERTENNEARRPPAMCAGVFRCLCCNYAKKERLPVARMLNHLRYWHSLNLIEGKLENDQYEQAWEVQMNPGRMVIAVRVAELGIYFFIVEIRDTVPMDLHAWLSMVASPEESDNYFYNLTLTGSDREATFSDTVMSVRSCEGQLKKRRRCLILDGVNMRAFYASQIVSVRLSIKRATERRDELRSEPRAALRMANLSLSDAGSTSSINSQEMLEARNVSVVTPAQQMPPQLPPRTVQPVDNSPSAQLNRNAHPQQNSNAQHNVNAQNYNSTFDALRDSVPPQLPSRMEYPGPGRTAQTIRNSLPPQRPTRMEYAVVSGQTAASAPAQLSRNARRRLRRRLNNVQTESFENRSQSPVIQLRSFERPVAQPVQQNGGQQVSANNRRPRTRR